jgi:hypothetical protein
MKLCTSKYAAERRDNQENPRQHSKTPVFLVGSSSKTEGETVTFGRTDFVLANPRIHHMERAIESCYKFYADSPLRRFYPVRTVVQFSALLQIVTRSNAITINFRYSKAVSLLVQTLTTSFIFAVLKYLLQKLRVCIKNCSDSGQADYLWRKFFFGNEKIWRELFFFLFFDGCRKRQLKS